MKKYSTSTELLLKKLSFRRIVQNRYKYHFEQLSGKTCIVGKDIRIKKLALEAFQVIIEDILQKLTEDAISNVRHFGKKRLYVKDLKYMYELKYSHITNRTINKKRNTKNSNKEEDEDEDDLDYDTPPLAQEEWTTPPASLDINYV